MNSFSAKDVFDALSGMALHANDVFDVFLNVHCHVIQGTLGHIPVTPQTHKSSRSQTFTSRKNSSRLVLENIYIYEP